MPKLFIRRAFIRDAPRLAALLHEWLNWDPKAGRLRSISHAIGDREFLLAEVDSELVGFIHFVLHEDVIDGAPNAFITAFYVQNRFRGKGIGTRLLHGAIAEAVKRGAAFMETSTLHAKAKTFYEKNGFKQMKDEIGEVFLELDVSERHEAQ